MPKNCGRALVEAALEVEELATSARQNERQALIEEAASLAGVTDPDARREALTKAGLRVGFWEELFTLWRNKYWWQ